MNLRGRERGKRANREVEMSTTRRNTLRKITFFREISCGGYLFLHFGEHILWRAFVLAFLGDTIRYTIIYHKMVW